MLLNLAQKHTRIALAYFLLIAMLGVFLRLFPLLNVAVNYKFIVHTHSHIALMGWVYTALTTLIYQLFLKDNIPKKKYKKLFWALQITLIGMLLSFPFTGYALFSILFSTLFLGVSFVFVYCFFKFTTVAQKKLQSYKMIRLALWFMVFSSLGPLSLGAIMNTAGKGSDLYRNSIYFYLHFQYNGWFLVTLLGFFLYLLEKNKIALPQYQFKQFYVLFGLGVVLTFLLSLLWMDNLPILIPVIVGVGGLLQIGAIFILAKHSVSNALVIKEKLKPMTFTLLKIVSFLFVIKLVVQLISVFPVVSNIALLNFDLVIGYLHWVFLGVVSVGLFLFFHHFKLLKLSKKIVLLYLIGFFTTEFLIFYRGGGAIFKYLVIVNFNSYLVVASVFLLTAIAMLVIKQLLKK